MQTDKTIEIDKAIKIIQEKADEAVLFHDLEKISKNGKYTVD